MQLDVHSDRINKIKEIKRTNDTLKLYTGMDEKEIAADLNEKIMILQWLVKHNIDDVHAIGHLMAMYYTGEIKDISKLNPKHLMP